jgi:hypothetical protein
MSDSDQVARVFLGAAPAKASLRQTRTRWLTPAGWLRSDINVKSATPITAYTPHELSSSTVATCPGKEGQPKAVDELLIKFETGLVMKRMTDRCGKYCSETNSIDNFNADADTCNASDTGSLGTVTTIILGR